MESIFKKDQQPPNFSNLAQFRFAKLGSLRFRIFIGKTPQKMA
jgi:hypothetical protein